MVETNEDKTKAGEKPTKDFPRWDQEGTADVVGFADDLGGVAAHTGWARATQPSEPFRNLISAPIPKDHIALKIHDHWVATTDKGFSDKRKATSGTDSAKGTRTV